MVRLVNQKIASMDKLKSIPLVFNVSIGNTGNYWFLSLLDSHEQILILPPFCFDRSWKLISAQQAQTPGEMLALWRNVFDGNINAWNLQGELEFFSSKNEAELFYFRFESLLTERGLARVDVFWSIYEAYSEVRKIDISKIRVIVAHEHLPFSFKNIVKDFPEARILTMVRDVRVVMAGSWRRCETLMKKDINDYNFNFVFESWMEGQHILKTFYLQMGEKFKVVKNENLNNDLETGMREISDWLGINFTTSLTNSTFFGKPWGGRSSYVKDGQTAIQDPMFYSAEKIEKRWQNELSFSQIVMIESFYRDLMLFFNYSCETSDNFFWKLYGRIFFILPRKKQILRWMESYPNIHEFMRVRYKLKNSVILNIWNNIPSFIKMLAVLCYSIGLRFKICFFPGDRSKRYS